MMKVDRLIVGNTRKKQPTNPAQEARARLGLVIKNAQARLSKEKLAAVPRIRIK
jgi:hypothetical protein